MRGFETLCSSALWFYETLAAEDPEMDTSDLVSFTVDRAMSELAHPAAVIDLVLEQPEILNWKVPGEPFSRDIEGAEYIKAAVRNRVEMRVRAALDS